MSTIFKGLGHPLLLPSSSLRQTESAYYEAAHAAVIRDDSWRIILTSDSFSTLSSNFPNGTLGRGDVCPLGNKLEFGGIQWAPKGHI